MHLIIGQAYLLFRMELLQLEKSCKMSLCGYPDLFLAEKQFSEKDQCLGCQLQVLTIPIFSCFHFVAISSNINSVRSANLNISVL